MNKQIITVAVICSASALIIWFLWSGLWLERLHIFSRMPLHGKNWKNETEKFEKLYPKEGADCFFLGDSHIEQCEWQELLPEIHSANRGIGSEPTNGLLSRISFLPDSGNGRFVILQTGINDIIYGEDVSTVSLRYAEILDYLKDRNYQPVATLVFPVRYLKNTNDKVSALNAEITRICREKKCSIININPTITSGNLLSAEFSADGIHLNYRGYCLWKKEIRKALKLAPDSCFR